MESEMPEWVDTEPSAMAGVQVECRVLENVSGPPEHQGSVATRGGALLPEHSLHLPARRQANCWLKTGRKETWLRTGLCLLLCWAHLSRRGKAGAQSPAVLCQKHSGIIPLKSPCCLETSGPAGGAGPRLGLGLPSEGGPGATLTSGVRLWSTQADSERTLKGNQKGNSFKMIYPTFLTCPVTRGEMP